MMLIETSTCACLARGIQLSPAPTTPFIYPLLQQAFPLPPYTRGIGLNLSLLFKFEMVRTLAPQVLHSTKDKLPRLSNPGSELSSLFSC